MKATFKPLSLAVAVATASAGYAGIVNAQVLSDNQGLGDLAIVPYYTVNTGWSTGVHVINSSDRTQVVKVRMRRAVDSMDALDFNVVMSPNDVWTGFLTQEGGDPGLEEIRFYTGDTSCTVPALTAGDVPYFSMPAIYRLGAEEGYMEIMAMGSPADEGEPIARDALHQSDGIPEDCDRVRDNFFGGTTAGDYANSFAALPSAGARTRGVINSRETMQYTSSSNTDPEFNTYTDSGNVLKVSYFIKSDELGTEFGNDAVHIANFMTGPSITNQQVGINEGDLQGFDHPDLNGGAPTSSSASANFLNVPGVAQRGRYNGVRNALGASAVINDWSAAVQEGDFAFTVDTDWVVTTPGQYLMLNLAAYIDGLEGVVLEEDIGDIAACQPGVLPSQTPGFSGGPSLNPYDSDPNSATYGANCDYRDIPLTVSAFVYDREEQGILAQEEDLVVSPQPPGVIESVNFNREVNVVQWGSEVVLGSDRNIVVPVPAGAASGWAKVSVTPDLNKQQGICQFTDFGATVLPVACLSTSTPVPLVGFVAWQRNFVELPTANYGRVVGHSYE